MACRSSGVPPSRISKGCLLSLSTDSRPGLAGGTSTIKFANSVVGASERALGAGRIAVNGTRRTRSTYALAVLAKRHGPFYIPAPCSLSIRAFPMAPIEERPAAEVTGYRGTRWAPEGVSVRDPALDVTPADLITGI